MKFYLFWFRGYGVFLQRIVDDDPPRVYHNHEWDSLNIYFGTIEQGTLKGTLFTYEYVDIVSCFWMKATQFHRIQLPCGPVWRLCFHGRAYNPRKKQRA